MKSFHFALGQALRWRATQVDIERSRVALTAKRLQDLRAEIASRHAECLTGAGQLSSGPCSGTSLVLWAAFSEQSRRRIHELEASAARAEQALTAQMELLAEANRKVQLLENLKERQRSRWQADFNRDLEAFAGESYLFRLQSKSRMGA